MKLPIRKEYFDLIKSGKKTAEFRDAHITFVCEETGEKLRKEILSTRFIDFVELPDDIQDSGMFNDERIIIFKLGDAK